MTIECFSNSKWVGIAVFSVVTILFFSIGAPTALLVALWRRRDRLGEKTTYKRLGILYGAWRPGCYFFEPVELFFKLLLWVAVVASNDEQIQNAAVASLLIIFVMVRVGVHPSKESWKDYAEVIALGFSLVLKLHDMVHSYLVASQKTSVNEDQRLAWQFTIDESDAFLVTLFAAIFAFVILRLVFRGSKVLLKKRCARRYLRGLFCECRHKCFPSCCRDTLAKDTTETVTPVGGNIGAPRPSHRRSKGLNLLEMAERKRRAAQRNQVVPATTGEESKQVDECTLSAIDQIDQIYQTMGHTDNESKGADAEDPTCTRRRLVGILEDLVASQVRAELLRRAGSQRRDSEPSVTVSEEGDELSVSEFSGQERSLTASIDEAVGPIAVTSDMASMDTLDIIVGPSEPFAGEAAEGTSDGPRGAASQQLSQRSESEATAKEHDLDSEVTTMVDNPVAGSQIAYL
jgi:hypothetical protein